MDVHVHGHVCGKIVEYQTIKKIIVVHKLKSSDNPFNPFCVVSGAEFREPSTIRLDATILYGMS